MISGFKDSTVIYLADFSRMRNDSTYIIAGKFQFTGTLRQDAEERGLIIKNNEKDYKIFWVEKTKMTIAAKKGKCKMLL